MKRRRTVTMSAFYRRYGGPCATCRVARDYHQPASIAEHPFTSLSDQYRAAMAAKRRAHPETSL